VEGRERPRLVLLGHADADGEHEPEPGVLAPGVGGCEGVGGRAGVGVVPRERVGDAERAERPRPPLARLPGPHRRTVTVRVATAPPAATRTTYTPAGRCPASRVSSCVPAG